MILDVCLKELAEITAWVKVGILTMKGAFGIPRGLTSIAVLGEEVEATIEDMVLCNPK